MKIVIFGLTITSSWGNGHATTYRSLVKALACRGHQTHFVEKDVEWYRSNRDLATTDFCTVHLYQDWHQAESSLLTLSIDADVVMVGSYFPDAIKATYSLLNADCGPLLFYDIDTPVTLAQLREHGQTSYLDPVLIPRYDAYLSFTGGPTLEELESTFGANRAYPFYCSVDPDNYFPSEPRHDYACDLSYLGTYSADRQAKIMGLLDSPARQRRDRRFIVAGPQYPAGIPWADNVMRIDHLPPDEHRFFYSSSRFSLNVTRADMVETGYSPSVRLFEASACGATIISDSWPGIESILTPGEEILLPNNSAEVLEILLHTSDETRMRIGKRARERILAAHTSAHRALDFERIVGQVSAAQIIR